MTEQFNWDQFITSDNSHQEIDESDHNINNNISLKEKSLIETFNEEEQIHDIQELELRLLGFYQLPKQNMNPESKYVECAKKLEEYLYESFKKIESINSPDSIIKDLYRTGVFIFKDKKSKLYAYFPKKRIARISEVKYNKKYIKEASFSYKAWFKVGQDFFKNNDIEQSPLRDDSSIINAYLKTKVTKTDRKKCITDELGVKYDSSYKRLLLAPPDITEYQIHEGVEVICDNAFASSKIIEITLPKSIKYIGSEAFSSCKNLKFISLPNGLLTIQDDVFNGCISLSAINIPQSVEYIGINPFAFCDSIKITNDSPHYVVENNILMTQNRKKLIAYCGYNENIIIPSTIEEIGQYGFGMCHSIKKISMFENVKIIEKGAFIECENLEEVIMPNSLSNVGLGLGQYVFSHCYKLKKINIPQGIKIISKRAFSQCMSLESIVLSNSIKEISTYAFQSCTSLTSVTLSDNIEYISDKAFQSCSSLEKIVFPKSLKKIGYFAFRHCGLSSIWFYCKDIEIEERAFDGCPVKEVHCINGNLINLQKEFPDATIYEDLVHK